MPFVSDKEFVGVSEAFEKLKEVGKGLTCGSFNKGYSVLVIGIDGLICRYQPAFVRKWKNWYLVWTEHAGYHPFEEEEVERIYFSRRMKVKELNPNDGF